MAATLNAGQTRRSPGRDLQKNAAARLVPQALHPMLRAFVYGYASSVGPRLLGLLLKHLKRQNRKPGTPQKPGSKKESNETFLRAVIRILRGGLEWQRFPTFCAVLVGGSTLLQVPIRRLVSTLMSGLTKEARERITRSTAAFIAGWYSMKLLQTKDTDEFVIKPASDANDLAAAKSPKPTRIAGRTIDLTLFAVCRALDVVVGELWASRSAKRKAAGRWNKLDTFISKVADPLVFAASSGLIMWTWIYDSGRLPAAYRNWITTAAEVDHRLIMGLRGVRYRWIIYGKDTGQADLFGSLAKDLNLPVVWGDPQKTIPYPCDIVHLGTGPSCEWHAISRFLRGFKYALATYLPLNLILVIRNPSGKAVRKACVSSFRSASFLGTFIMLYYYGICLARSRVGPRWAGPSLEKRQIVDGGVCIGTGSALCGWSILIENASRRKDMALFVAPRALATVLPGKYDMQHQWRETLAFAISCAIVATCAQEKPERVRGVFGKLLGSVLARA